MCQWSVDIVELCSSIPHPNFQHVPPFPNMSLCYRMVGTVTGIGHVSFTSVKVPRHPVDSLLAIYGQILANVHSPSVQSECECEKRQHLIGKSDPQSLPQRLYNIHTYITWSMMIILYSHCPEIHRSPL